MNRIVYFAVTLAAAVMIICSCGRKKADDYFPLSVGNSWIYEAEIEGTDSLRTWKRKIERKEKIGAQEYAVLESLAEGSDESLVKEYCTKTPEGVIVAKRSYPDGEVSYDPPGLDMKLPPQVGQQWEWKGTIKGKKAEYSFAVEKKEKIKAGEQEYDCFKIVIKGSDETGERLEVSRWFASGIGMVKEESSLFRGTKEMKMNTLLKSYEITEK
jgi:hypothetical protein